MPQPIEGACLCGTVTFEIAPPYRWFAHCHCSLCRKQHGTLHGTGLGVAHDRFHWRSGDHDIVHFRSTPAFERPFCRHCGSAVPALAHDARTWHVPAGLLLGDIGERPRTHIFAAAKATLETITDSLPQHALYPPGIEVPAIATRAAHSTRASVAGSCLCGSVAFELDTPPRTLVKCHCSLCRRSRGTGFATTLLGSPHGFRWAYGADRRRAYALPASRTYRTDFCADCGAPMPTFSKGAPFVLVPAGAVDTPLAPLPTVHIHLASKAEWCEISDDWPQFAELPPAERRAELFL